MPEEPAKIEIPRDLLPADGRFGCGPSKVRPEQVAALAGPGAALLGTSHRQAPVRALVQRVRDGLAELFSLPDDYLVVLGNGGTTAFWEVAAFGLVRQRAQHLSFGEFSSKFAAVTTAAPWLDEPTVIHAAPGSHPEPSAETGADAYALTHNETSTGVAMPIRRVRGRRQRRADAGRRHQRRGRAAGVGGRVRRVLLRAAEVLRLRRRAVDRPDVARPRWTGPRRSPPATGTCPSSCRCQAAIANSRQQQTYNTPALATLIMLAEQLDWMLGQGGLAWTVARTAQSSAHLYEWAERTPYATPFVTDPEQRSQVVGTIDFAERVDAGRAVGDLRAQRDRGHRVLPQAGPQPAAHRHVPGHRPVRRPGADGLHRLRGRAALARRPAHRVARRWPRSGQRPARRSAAGRAAEPPR